MSNVEAALERIAARRPQIIDLSLDRVHAALARLGDPHKCLPPVFHVAGTNGKGSTIAFLRSMLEAAEKSVHVYTSPHLVRFNERIVLAGREIADDALIDALNRVDVAVGDEKLTYFETATCAAFLAFVETPADYLILEVGLGGRLDATNVLARPLAAIVAPVDFDHQQFLGETIGQIAAEKAGVFRKGAPAVIGRQDPAALAVLLQHADEIGAEAFAMGRDWDAYAERGRLVFQDEAGLLDLDAPRLPGAHQYDNAALAVAALRFAGLDIPDALLSKGVSSAFWPARLQRLSSGPLIDLATDLLGEAPEIWLDGGHNPHAGRSVAGVMADMETRHSRPLILIAGMQANKNAAGYFENFNGIARYAYCVSADHRGVMAARDLAEAARLAGLTAEPVEDVSKAVSRACQKTQHESPRFLICGSLYLAGEILRDHA